MNKVAMVAGFVFLTLLVAGCSSPNSFTLAARQGDTVALAVGWNKNITRGNLSVKITSSAGPVITYPVGDTRIRAIANMYPDPVSKLVVGTETAQPLGVNANTLGSAINAGATGADRDWGQTMVFIDLPNPLATGTATIELLQGATAVAPPIVVAIVAGVGSANTFAGSSPLPTGTTTANMLGSLERSTSYVVTFGGSTVIPYAIQLDLNRTANIGKPWIANPRGDLKNVAWNDNGSKITVLMTPANGLTPPAMSYFKFYVSGGIAGLAYAANSLKAYDINGNAISGVTPVITAIN
ncbi:MAG: hypothetical protein IDH49_14615 [Gammaproteobacteria bacterium]|nr:hypothetical protein [Gammaproteobacteria bacterium]